MLVVGDCLTKAFKEMKHFFLPYNFKNWFKFGLIGALANRFGSSFNSNFNLSNGSEFESLDIAKYLSLILFGVISIAIFGIFMTFIGSVITFILIENCDNKKMKLSFNFKKNIRKGWQLFLFSILLLTLGIGVIVGISWPFVSVFVNNGWSFSGLSLASFPWSYLWISIPVLIIWLFVATIVGFLVNQFAIFDVYRKNISLYKAFKNSWVMFKKNLGEFLLYYLIIVGVSILVVMIISLVILLIFLPIGFLLILLMFVSPLIASILGVFFIIAGFILGIAFVSAPLSYLLTRFNLNFYDAIHKKS